MWRVLLEIFHQLNKQGRTPRRIPAWNATATRSRTPCLYPPRQPSRSTQPVMLVFNAAAWSTMFALDKKKIEMVFWSKEKRYARRIQRRRHNLVEQEKVTETTDAVTASRTHKELNLVLRHGAVYSPLGWWDMVIYNSPFCVVCIILGPKTMKQS